MAIVATIAITATVITNSTNVKPLSLRTRIKQTSYYLKISLRNSAENTYRYTTNGEKPGVSGSQTTKKRDRNHAFLLSGQIEDLVSN
jgi:hypothetical protein|tara:strand:- start:10822 stop:11082 length:261 start_codon:yes stop_codon:yes gene_type:complete